MRVWIRLLNCPGQLGLGRLRAAWVRPRAAGEARGGRAPAPRVGGHRVLHLDARPKSLPSRSAVEKRQAHGARGLDRRWAGVRAAPVRADECAPVELICSRRSRDQRPRPTIVLRVRDTSGHFQVSCARAHCVASRLRARLDGRCSRAWSRMDSIERDTCARKGSARTRGVSERNTEERSAAIAPAS